jgi:hypothetical protein
MARNVQMTVAMSAIQDIGLKSICSVEDSGLKKKRSEGFLLKDFNH